MKNKQNPQDIAAALAILKNQPIETPPMLAAAIIQHVAAAEPSRFSLLRIVENVMLVMEALYIPKPRLCLMLFAVAGVIMSHMVVPDTTAPDILFGSLLTGGKEGAL